MDVLLRGTPAQKCTFMFDVFDENGDKVLTPEDILRFLRHPGALFAATDKRNVQNCMLEAIWELRGGGACIFIAQTRRDF